MRHAVSLPFGVGRGWGGRQNLSRGARRKMGPKNRKINKKMGKIENMGKIEILRK